MSLIFYKFIITEPKIKIKGVDRNKYKKSKKSYAKSKISKRQGEMTLDDVCFIKT